MIIRDTHTYKFFEDSILILFGNNLENVIIIQAS